MECEFAVVGAGPAGLSGAIAAAKAGVREVVVIDENAKPGGSYSNRSISFLVVKNIGRE